MPRLVLDKFNGLDTNSDPYSTEGSPELSNVDISLRKDVVKAKGEQLVTSTSRYDIVAVGISNSTHAGTTYFYTEDNLFSELSIGDAIVIGNLNKDTFGTQFNNKAYTVTSVTTTYVEVSVDSSSYTPPTKSVDYTTSGLGWDLIPIDYDVPTLASVILAELNGGTAVISEIQYWNGSAWVTYPSTDFLIGPNDSVNANCTTVGDYTLTGQRDYVSAATLVSSWNGFSKTDGYVYTVGELGDELGASIKQIARYTGGAWILWDYDTSFGVGMTESTTIDANNGYYVEMHNARNWSPELDNVGAFDALQGIIDTTIKDVPLFATAGGLDI